MTSPSAASPSSPPPPQQAERSALCDLALEVGPDQPTLCEGWTAHHLLAHLHVREHNPAAGLGIVVSAVSGWHDRGIERAMARWPYPELVERVRSGPPLLWKPFDAAANLNEFVVHHEDLRRGAGDTTPRPVDEVADVEAAVWTALGKGAKLMTRSLKGYGVELVDPDGDTVVARTGATTVRIVGRPIELALYLFGRRGAAQVDVEGDDDAVAALLGADLGI